MLAARAGERGLDRAARDHLGHRAPVVRGGADVGDRCAPCGGGGRGGGNRLGAAVGAPDAASASGTRRIVGASAVIATRASRDGAVVRA